MNAPAPLYYETMRTVLLILLTLSLLPRAGHGDEEAVVPATTLAQLAAQADLVALVQARDTDYLLRRDIPVSGSAYLKLLIPYKADRPTEIIEVYESGLHEHECYFPQVTVFEEGRRYLVFLRKDPKDPERYRGMEQGCALEVLVDASNRYAMRYPLQGLKLQDDHSELAQPMEFSDAYAVVADDDLPPAERKALLEGGYITEYVAPEPNADIESFNWMPEPEQPGLQWKYTHGIELTALRKKLGQENLTQDRHQLRPAESP